MEDQPKTPSTIVDQVEDLNEEVRSLALNLAIYLAKAKAQSRDLDRLEPDFIRLVNGTVRIVQELALLINRARSADGQDLSYPSNSFGQDHVESRLTAIIDECARITTILNGEPSQKSPEIG